MRILFIFLLTISFGLAMAQDGAYLSHDIENEKQGDFPGLAISIKERPILYVVDINKTSSKSPISSADYVFEEKMKLNAGAKVKISSYIIAKDLLDSVNFNSLSKKTSRKEIVSVLNSGNTKAIKDLLLKLAEKKRGAKDENELQKIQNEIDKSKSGDDPASLAFFQTGMIEVLPLNSEEFKGKENVRFFIPLDKIEDLDLSQGEAKASVIKSVSLLGFKNIKMNINFGALPVETIQLIDEAEANFQNFCQGSCPIQDNFGFGDFMNDVISISTYSLINEPDLDFDKINEGSMLQQACLLNEMNKFCPNDGLKLSIQKLVSEKRTTSYLSSIKKEFPSFCTKFYGK